MKSNSIFLKKKQTMTKKLFGYMFILAALILVAIFSGLFLLEQFTGAKEKTYENLDFQMDIFQRDIISHMEDLAVATNQLSDIVKTTIEDYLEEENLSFEDLNDSKENITEIQSILFDKVRQKLLESHAYGSFVLLDARVNGNLSKSKHSRTGIYLQRSSIDTSDESILLYRGIPTLARKHKIMPHRKWHLEFNTKKFPDYDDIMRRTHLHKDGDYHITNMITLPGTSEKAVLLILPLLGKDGTPYGLCGFEINASLFKSNLAQPSTLDHMVFLLSKGSDQIINAKDSFVSGIKGGYFLPPKGDLEKSEFGGGLSSYENSSNSYVGVNRSVNLGCEEENFVLTILIPRKDYDRQVISNIIRIGVLLLLILFFAIISSLFLSRRYLSPILKSLEQIKEQDLTKAKSEILEIDDLFAFLENKDDEYEKMLGALEKEKESAEKEKLRLEKEYEQAQINYETVQNQLSRLAYERKETIDPKAYERFLTGLERLTPTENKIFNYYLEGHTVKEILALANIKESTLRYHNQNIYGKLGVNSLKQLLRYAIHMREVK